MMRLLAPTVRVGLRSDHIRSDQIRRADRNRRVQTASSRAAAEEMQRVILGRDGNVGSARPGDPGTYVLVHGGVCEIREWLSACLRLCCRCGLFVRLQASTNNSPECAMSRGSLGSV
jgi:hypothetical protein